MSLISKIEMIINLFIYDYSIEEIQFNRDVALQTNEEIFSKTWFQRIL